MNQSEYQISEWPRIRNLIGLLLRQQRPNTMHGFVELDITVPLERIEALQANSQMAITLNTYMLYAISRIAARHEEMRTYRHGRKKIVFRNVDIMHPMLKTLPNGLKVPVMYIVRRADTKSLAELHTELKNAATQTDLTEEKEVRFRRSLIRLPYWIQALVYRYIFSHPVRMNRYFGNLGMTTLRQSGFHVPMVSLPPNVYAVQLSLNNVFEQFVPDRNKNPVLRKFIRIGGGFDHLVLDGMHLASITRDFVDFCAKGEGLDDGLSLHESSKINLEGAYAQESPHASP
jgi:hypothetical protein